MKNVLQAVFGVFFLVQLLGCEETDVVETEFANTTIDTRFVNSDSVSALNTVLDSLGGQTTTLDSIVNSTNAQINQLNVRINLEPENDSIDIFRMMVEELQIISTNLSDSVTAIRSESTLLTGMRDSLNAGYSFVQEVVNVNSGASESIEALIADYPLPLAVESQSTLYEIVIDNESFRFVANYQLSESLDIEGRVRLVLDEIDIELPSSENTFDSLTLTNADIYIFHY